MIRYKKYIYTVTCLLGSFLFNSCADEAVLKPEVEIVDGLPVTINMSFSPDASVVATRATETEENAIKDLYVIIFNAKDGSFSDKHYFTNEQLVDFGKYADGKGGNLTLNTSSGYKKILAVANVTTTNFSSGTENDLKQRIDNFFEGSNNSLNQWLQFTATMVNEDTDWGSGNFLMSGKFGETAEAVTDGSCILTLDGKIYNAEGTSLSGGKIWLTRTAASVAFNVYADASGVKFSMTSWEIRNVPKTVNLFGDNTDHTSDVFQPENFNGSFSNNSFNFYVLENLQGNVDGATDNHTRGKNAPANATYVVIKGKYEGPGTHYDPANSSPEIVMADVTYYVYLGYINKNGSTQNNSNFDVYRNFRYTYNVKVKGVQEIIVEAEGGDEDKGVDGNVLFAGSFIEVDSHYSRQKLSFARIADEEPEAVRCLVRSVKTGWSDVDVFPNGVYDPNVDISWIHFVKASEVERLWEDGGKGPDFTHGDADRSKGIMNLNELVEGIKSGDEFFGEGNNSVDVYAYIDEHYHEDEASLSSFVNDQPGTVADKTRSIKINLKNTVRTGGNSTVSSAEYVILQKPIVTIFDTQYNGGWGFEYYNENLPDNYDEMTLSEKAIDAGISFGTVSGGMTFDNGYANALTQYNALSNKNWNNTDIIGSYNQNDPDDLNLNKAKAYIACMNRNRDENGNGVIDNNEIKWYLPAINQYEYYWVGWDAIPKDATLFPEEHRNQNLAEIRETFSFHSSGGHRFQADEGSAVRHNDNQGYMHIRCARNIGTGNNVSVASATSYANNSFLVEVVGLPQTSLRHTAQRDKLLSHNEYDNLNRLYKTIEVKTKTIGAVKGGLYGWDIVGFSEESSLALHSIEISEYVNKKNNNPCDYYNTGGESGWRPANQRELIAIMIAGKGYLASEGLTGEYAQTMFSLWDGEEWTEKGLKREVTKNGENSYLHLIGPASRVGYAYNYTANSGGGQMELPFRAYTGNAWDLGGQASGAWDFSCKVRCVRDK